MDTGHRPTKVHLPREITGVGPFGGPEQGATLWISMRPRVGTLGGLLSRKHSRLGDRLLDSRLVSPGVWLVGQPFVIDDRAV